MVATELRDEDRSLETEVEFPASHKAPFLESGWACVVYDHAATRCRLQLDTMDRTTRLACRVPRSDCPKHGIRTMLVPWAGPDLRFTEDSELQVFEVLLVAQSQ